ncbi:thiamine phosphate synthase [Thalassobacillus pellis]|uniref:thiamine phosphate synthase n=1 Tax=Thalassobacillus pellis TaxID=748008 RepID=UPI0019608FDB|nr:thiamine phosphate synthase [Thalassobacillus pellis]MBM7553798.1 thiazole tautomerase (transcriptional regulator TenI) [Thalassobacillus pellis]
MEFHLISNGEWPLGKFAEWAAPLTPYVDFFHLREKMKSAKDIGKGVEQMMNLGIPPTKIIINDRIDVAHALGVAGVQLAFHSINTSDARTAFPALRIGKSIHSEKEAVVAENAGADYVMCGHIFPSKSKPDQPARGLELLERVVNQVNIPVIAIGGITPRIIHKVSKTGAGGVAVMSGLMDTVDPQSVISHYMEAIKRGDTSEW